MPLEPFNPSAARVRIKICGITRAEDAALAVQLGADALGFVGYAKSPRFIALADAAALAARLPPFVTPVRLLVNASAEEVRATLRTMPQALLQFHGDERSEFCESFGAPYLRALRVAPQTTEADLLASARAHARARGFVLDTHSSAYGGSGQRFDWQQFAPRLGERLPLILSGGLTAENIAAAIAHFHPGAVDVSSGVESAPGIKDAGRMREFFAAQWAAFR